MQLRDSMMVDNINPLHYKSSNIETIDAIKSQVSKSDFCGYLRCSCLKYLCRAGKKSLTGADEATVALEDYSKAQWYLNRLIQEVSDERKTR
jgi:hypothetical protein